MQHLASGISVGSAFQEHPSTSTNMSANFSGKIFSSTTFSPDSACMSHREGLLTARFAGGLRYLIKEFHQISSWPLRSNKHKIWFGYGVGRKGPLRTAERGTGLRSPPTGPIPEGPLGTCASMPPIPSPALRGDPGPHWKNEIYALNWDPGFLSRQDPLPLSGCSPPVRPRLCCAPAVQLGSAPGDWQN